MDKNNSESDQKMMTFRRLVNLFLIGAVGKSRLAVGTWYQAFRDSNFS